MSEALHTVAMWNSGDGLGWYLQRVEASSTDEAIARACVKAGLMEDASKNEGFLAVVAAGHVEMDLHDGVVTYQNLRALGVPPLATKPALPDLDAALKALARIALTEANGNSEPDTMAAALDEAVSVAQAFFKTSGHRLAEYAEQAEMEANFTRDKRAEAGLS